MWAVNNEHSILTGISKAMAMSITRDNRNSLETKRWKVSAQLSIIVFVNGVVADWQSRIRMALRLARMSFFKFSLIISFFDSFVVVIVFRLACGPLSQDEEGARRWAKNVDDMDTTRQSHRCLRTSWKRRKMSIFVKAFS